MTRSDYRAFCIILAFFKVCSTAPGKSDQTEQALQLARYAEEFCRDHIDNVFPPVIVTLANEQGAEAIDARIDHHVAELRHSETTVLPQDKETLLKFYDRLQQRKSRRMQAAFYDMANVEVLANAVLKYLDEEIEDMESRL